MAAPTPRGPQAPAQASITQWMQLTPMGSEASTTEVVEELESEPAGGEQPVQDQALGAPPPPASWLAEARAQEEAAVGVLNIGGRQALGLWAPSPGRSALPLALPLGVALVMPRSLALVLATALAFLARSLWEPLWEFLETFGSFWSFLGASGSLWELLGVSGNLL